MSEEKEITLFEIEIDTSKAKSQLESTNKRLLELRKEAKDARGEFKKTGDMEKYNKSLVKIELETKKLRTEKNRLIKETNSVSNSYSALSARTAALRARQKELDTSTKEGREEYIKLTKQIEKNNTTLKSADKDVNVHTRNVGNYSSALDGATGSLGRMSPGLSSAVSGIKGLTTAAKAFIATPLGMILAGIAAAFAAIHAWLTRSQAGMDFFTKWSNRIGATLDVLLDTLGAIGESIFNAFTNPVKAVKNLWQTIKTEILDRMRHLTDAFISFGSVVSSSMKLDFSEAGRAADEMTQSLKKASTVKFDGVKNLLKDLEEANKNADEITRLTIEREEHELKITRRIAERKRDVADLIRLTKEEQENSEENLQRLAKAQELTRKNLEDQIEQQRLAVEIAELELANSSDSKNNRAAQLEVEKERVKLIELEENASNKLRKLSNRTNEERNRQAQKQRDALKEQIELMELRAEIEAENTEDDEERKNILINAIRERTSFELKNEKLTATQRKIIRLNSTREIERIETEHQERVKEKRLQKEKEEQERQKKRIEQQERIANIVEQIELNRLKRQAKSEEDAFDRQRDLINREEELKIEDAIKNIENEEEFLLERQKIEEEYAHKRMQIAEAEKDYKSEMKRQEEERHFLSEQAKLRASADFLRGMSDAMRHMGENHKELAIASTIIDTYAGAQQAYRSQFIPGDPSSVGRAIMAASAAVAQGLGRVAQIKNTETPQIQQVEQFRRGGVIEGRRHASGGALIEGERGEGVINRNSMAIPELRQLASSINEVGGGVKFPGTQAMSRSSTLSHASDVRRSEDGANKAPIRAEVSVKEIKRVINSVGVIEGRRKLTFS